MAFPSICLAETAEQAFKRSLQESIDHTVDPRKFLAFGVALVALIIFAAVFNRWRSRPGRLRGPRPLNSPAKLIREVAKTTNLRPTEVKQLKILCDQQQIQNPLVMLLCPSVLGKAVKENQRKIDRNILGTLARKIARGTREPGADRPSA
jgi:hypothetical protein